MGFSQSDVTKADRKRAEEIMDDINIAYVTAQECGGDEVRAAERELAYSIGLIRAEERELIANYLEAVADLKQPMSMIIETIRANRTAALAECEEAK